MKIIRNRQVLEDDWHLVGDDEDAGPYAIVSLARWNTRREALVATGPAGFVLRSDESPYDAIGPNDASLIAVDFPKFTDGRGYTSARSLRSQLGYRGELRAVGDILRDQIFLMHRCGIDSFALKPGKDIATAVAAYEDFSVTYQAAADDERPLFRRVHR